MNKNILAFIATAICLLIVAILTFIFIPTAQGEDWSKPKPLYTTNDDRTEMAMASDNETNSHIVCSEKDWVVYLKCDAWGQILIPPRNFAGDDASDCGYVGIAVDSRNDAHIVWDDKRSGHAEVYYAKISTNGSLLQTSRLISDEDGSESFMPDIAVDSEDNLHVVWLAQKRRGSGGSGINYQEVYYQKLDNNGEKIGKSIDITPDDLETPLPYRSTPRVCPDSQSAVFLTWTDSRDDSFYNDTSFNEKEIYFCKLDRDGNKVVDDTRLTDNEYNYIGVDIAVDALDCIHIAGRGDESSNRGRLTYIKLDDNGTVLKEIEDLSDISDRSYYPTVTIIHDTNAVIFYHGEEHNNITFCYSQLDGKGDEIKKDEVIWETPSANRLYSIFGTSDDKNLYVAWSFSEAFNNDVDMTRIFYMTNRGNETKEETGDNEDDSFLLLEFPVILVGIATAYLITKKRRDNNDQ